MRPGLASRQHNNFVVRSWQKGFRDVESGRSSIF